MGFISDKRALSPVIATIILSGVVLILGISVWSFTHGVSSNLQDSYFEDVQEQIDAISERFIIEHISYDNNIFILTVWIYNYGVVDVEVDVYVKGDAEGSKVLPTSIGVGDLAEIKVALEDLSGGSELVVEAISRRDNIIYETYVVPS